MIAAAKEPFCNGFKIGFKIRQMDLNAAMHLHAPLLNRCTLKFLNLTHLHAEVLQLFSVAIKFKHARYNQIIFAWKSLQGFF